MKTPSMRYLAFIPVPVLIGITALLYFTVSPSLFFEPARLVLITNTLFITVLCLTVSFLAMKGYGETGQIQILLLGCGGLAYGIGAALAGLVRSIPGAGANLNVTVYNTAVLIAALFHFASALVLLSGAPPEAGSRHKDALLASGYLGVTLFIALLTWAGMEGNLPPFFIQGAGPTPLRQIVLGSAAVLFSFSFFIFMGMHLRSRDVFLYWYATALALIATGLTAVFIQRSVGSPLGWTGRSAQYLGCIYFLVAIMTARRRAQASGRSLVSVLAGSLSNAEEKFRVVAESAPDAIARFDREMRIIYANAAAFLLYGKRGGELIGKTVDEMSLSGEYRDLLKESIHRVFLGGETEEMEGCLPAEPGRRCYHSLCLPEHGPKGEVSNVFVVSRDLTESKAKEEALRASELRFRNIFDLSPVGIGMVTREGRVLEANPAMLRMFGYSREEAANKRVPELYETPSDREKILQELDRQGAVTDLAVRMKRKDGTVFDALLNIALVTCDGESCLQVICTDITERKRMEEELLRVASIVESSDDAIIGKTLEGIITSWNPGAERMYGYSEEEAVGKPITILLPEGSPDETAEILERIRGGEKVEHYETLRRRKDGSRINVSITVSPINDAAGAIIGASTIARDITERKRAETALLEAKEKYADLVNNLEVGVFRTTVGFHEEFLELNPAMVRMFEAASREELMAHTLDELYVSPVRHKAIIEKIMKQGAVQDEEVELRTLKGKKFWGAITKTMKRGKDGQAYLDGIIRDITDQKEAVALILELSLKDELTGLYNRRGFMTMAAQELNLADRLKQGLLLIYIDLDRMKWINDTLGHQEGDRALSDTAEILQNVFRSSDITARIGGDEFAVLALETSDTTGEAVRSRLLERILTHNAEHPRRGYELSLSIGLTRYDPVSPCSLEELLERGDREMYTEKQGKRIRRGE